MPDFSLERRYGADRGRTVIGLDEAGRGPWAGPVVAAAVWLDPEAAPRALLEQLDDSKKLTARRRTALFTAIEAAAGVRWGLGQASVAEVDRLNILAASLLAMGRAAENLGLDAGYALVDGNKAPALSCPVATVVGGDAISLSIAAASIMAKVSRDRIMAGLAASHPGYGWERNAGYGTAEHRAALERLGPCPHHRRSFKPVQARLR